MKGEGARQGPPTTVLIASFSLSAGATPNSLSRRSSKQCRAVARACGLSWVHDLVREEIRRLAERCAA